MDRLGEPARELQVRLAGLAPDQVGVGRVGQAARNRLPQALVRLVEAFERAFAGAAVTPQIAMTARDANLIKTYVRAGLGAGLLAEMATGTREDEDLRIIEAPAEIPECITWAVIPRGRVLRDYALSLLHGLAPQLDRRDLRRVLEGNQEPNWPQPPGWVELTQSIAA